MNAPVAVFAYNRPDHLHQVLVALASNDRFQDTVVFVYSDGPKLATDEGNVARVRTLVCDLDLPNVKLIESAGNKGLVRSIRDGVTEVTEEFGRVIVLEDDLVVGRHFLDFMNNGLDRYQHSYRVSQVCGHLLPTTTELPSDPFFVPLASSWGWATWKRSWDEFNAMDLRAGLQQLQRSSALRRRFDLQSSYPMYLTLRRSAAGRTESWAIWFQLYAFLAGRLALWPPRTLVHNIGTDGSGVHGRWFSPSSFTVASELSDTPISSFPDTVDVQPKVWAGIRRSLRAGNPRPYRLLSAWTTLFP